MDNDLDSKLSHITVLNNDVIVMCLYYIQPKEILLNCALVCKKWNEITKKNMLWKILYDIEFKNFSYTNSEIIKYFDMYDATNSNYWLTIYKKMFSYFYSKVPVFKITFIRNDTPIINNAITLPYFIVQKYYNIPYDMDKDIIIYLRYSHNTNELQKIKVTDLFKPNVLSIRISFFGHFKNNMNEKKLIYNKIDINDITPLTVNTELNLTDEIHVFTIEITNNDSYSYCIYYSSINTNKNYIDNLFKKVKHNYAIGYL
jgi:hypothetical protein